MIGIPLGLLYGNAMEWAIHKYILHGWGKDRKAFFSFHWHDHHKNARKGEMFDIDYATKSVFSWTPPGKEFFALVVAAIAHLPLLPVAPFFTLTVYYCAFNYYRVHKKSHQQPEWGRKHVPWHLDHHLGPNQDANWCVTKPWCDWVMGTRIPYIGTEKEVQDRKRLERLRARRPGAVPANVQAIAQS